MANFEKPDLDNIIEKFESMPEYDLDSLEIGKRLEVSTNNTTYTIEKREDGLYISGNPKYCPEPTKVGSIGSKTNRETTSIKLNKVVEGGYLEFTLPGRERPAIVTSEIVLVEEE